MLLDCWTDSDYPECPSDTWTHHEWDLNVSRYTPTQSPEATRPPTRSRVPSTRRTRLRPGRSPRSSSHILPGPPGTEVSWSSAPGPEPGLRLWGSGQRTWTQRLTDSHWQRLVHVITSTSTFGFPSVVNGCLVTGGCDDNARRISPKIWHLHVRCSSALFSVEHIVCFFFSSHSSSSHQTPKRTDTNSSSLLGVRSGNARRWKQNVQLISCCLTHSVPLAAA